MRHLKLTDEQVEDIRFCLARLAELDEKAAETEPLLRSQALRDQCNRFRELARTVSSAEEAD